MSGVQDRFQDILRRLSSLTRTLPAAQRAICRRISADVVALDASWAREVREARAACCCAGCAGRAREAEKDGGDTVAPLPARGDKGEVRQKGKGIKRIGEEFGDVGGGNCAESGKRRKTSKVCASSPRRKRGVGGSDLPRLGEENDASEGCRHTSSGSVSQARLAVGDLNGSHVAVSCAPTFVQKIDCVGLGQFKSSEGVRGRSGPPCVPNARDEPDRPGNSPSRRVGCVSDKRSISKSALPCSQPNIAQTSARDMPQDSNRALAERGKSALPCSQPSFVQGSARDMPEDRNRALAERGETPNSIRASDPVAGSVALLNDARSPEGHNGDPGISPDVASAEDGMKESNLKVRTLPSPLAALKAFRADVARARNAGATFPPLAPESASEPARKALPEVPTLSDALTAQRAGQATGKNEVGSKSSGATTKPCNQCLGDMRSRFKKLGRRDPDRSLAIWAEKRECLFNNHAEEPAVGMGDGFQRPFVQMHAGAAPSFESTPSESPPEQVVNG